MISSGSQLNCSRRGKARYRHTHTTEEGEGERIEEEKRWKTRRILFGGEDEGRGMGREEAADQVKEKEIRLALRARAE